jgi:hypothetical protein
MCRWDPVVAMHFMHGLYVHLARGNPAPNGGRWFAVQVIRVRERL